MREKRRRILHLSYAVARARYGGDDDSTLKSESDTIASSPGRSKVSRRMKRRCLAWALPHQPQSRSQPAPPLCIWPVLPGPCRIGQHGGLGMIPDEQVSVTHRKHGRLREFTAIPAF